MKKKLLVSSLILTAILIGAAAYLYFFYLPEFLLQKLPHNLKAEKVQFDLFLNKVQYFTVTGPSRSGCEQKTWLKARSLTIKLQDLEPSDIAIEKAMIHIERNSKGRFCPKFSPATVSRPMPSPLNVLLTESRIHIKAVQAKFSRVQTKIAYVDGRFTFSFRALDQYDGKILLKGSYGGQGDYLDIDASWPNVSKLPSGFGQRINYRFHRGRFSWQMKAKTKKNSGYELNHSLSLSDFSAKHIKTGNFFSSKNVDFLKLLTSKNGKAQLNFRVFCYYKDSPQKIVQRHRIAIRSTIKRAVKARMNPFLFWKP